jgi:hypothetical protein
MQNAFAQVQSVNTSTSSSLTDENKEDLYAEQKNLEQKINLLLSGIREKLTVQAVKERFESGLSDQIYAKAEFKCLSVQLKKLLNSSNIFTLKPETSIEEATYLAELLQSLNVLLNQEFVQSFNINTYEKNILHIHDSIFSYL